MRNIHRNTGFILKIKMIRYWTVYNFIELPFNIFK